MKWIKWEKTKRWNNGLIKHATQIRYSFHSMIGWKVYLTVIEGNNIKSNHDSHESCARASMALNLIFAFTHSFAWFVFIQRLFYSLIPNRRRSKIRCVWLKKVNLLVQFRNAKCKMSIDDNFFFFTDQSSQIARKRKKEMLHEIRNCFSVWFGSLIYYYCYYYYD